MEEIWKDIQGYEGMYQISNYGRVKSLNYRRTGKEKIMSCIVDYNGYLLVNLCKKGEQKNFYIHRLVAEAFIPNTENKPFIDHRNTIRDDNRVSNLRWVTQKENCNNSISRKNNSLAKKGKKRSEETKQKISSSMKDKQNTKGKHWKLENGKRVYY